MPSTTDRTTIKAAVEELLSKLRDGLVADPPTPTKPFRRVAVGAGRVENFPHPFLTLSLVRARPIGSVDDDKLMEVTVRFGIVTDVLASDPFDALLDKVGAVDDHLDSILDGGVIDGAEGFDERIWTFDEPQATSGARVATASALQTFVVAVERNWNRVPAS
jgi:hypothetical protein